MTDRDEFVAWVSTALYEAELALHNGDAAPRRALWSRNEPVSVLGAVRNAYGQQEIDELFTALGSSFSDCTSYAFDLQACDVAGDVAYRPAWSTSQSRLTVSRAPTRCGPARCTAANPASGGLPIAMATR